VSPDLKGRHFLSMLDLSAQEISTILETAATLKAVPPAEAAPALQGRTLAMIFQKPSLRTRVSFETGMFQLGGHAIYLAPGDVSLGERETTQDVALVLGLAIDSSGSMSRLWQATQSAARQFLETTLQKKDRAFLVDFDSNLRLLQSLTGDKQALFDALDRLVPRGGTALYDSILFSLLQYDGEPGRRALIVLTDGFDSESRADPNRAIDFGIRLGVPIYAITMSAGRGVRIPSRSGFSNEDMARGELAVVTDPTGGRFFRANTMEQVNNAFAQIQDELRKQYVLTYYSERAPEAGVLPKVKINRKGLVVRTALPLDLAD